MNASRIAPIPLAHVQAELVAFPLASEEGLSLGLTSLSPDLKDDTGRLWRSAERALVTASPSVSLDELVALRDDLWFRDCVGPEHELPLGDYLERVARRFLDVRGSAAVPRSAQEAAPGQTGDCDARSDWRWLSLALPPDLLLGGLASGGRAPLKVESVSPVLGRRLADDGFTEPHLHLNASFDFGRIWVHVVRGLADSSISATVFESAGAGFDEGKDLWAWLLHAAITRYILAGYLRAREESDTFVDYLEGLAKIDAVGTAHLASALDDFYRGRLELQPGDHAALRALYRFLIDVRSGPWPEDLDSLWGMDPIFPLLDSAVTTPPEIQLVARSLSYLKRFPKDHGFAGLFWQMIRVRCLFYRHLVQRPMTPGLQWFVRFFKRLKPARTYFSTTLKARMAASLCGEELGLRSLEVRTAPEDNLSKLYNEVRALNQALRPRSWEDRQEEGGREMEMGIVLHLTRDRGGNWFEGRPTAHWAGSHADPKIFVEPKPKTNSTGYRYGRFYKERKGEAITAARLLCFFPMSLEVVRGLDLCTDEAGVPSWVMAPLLRYMRDAGRYASAALCEARGREPVPPLRTSVHAGEDFVHLMSGLRRLDEALEFLGISEGDRLGHALSLGVEAGEWAKRAGKVPMPREERLFDLVWEWSWYSRQGRGVPGGRQALIQREVAEHSREIFGEEQAPWTLERLVRDLHDERVLRFLGFPDGPAPLLEKDHDNYMALLYLTNPLVFEQGRKIIWIDPTADVEALEHLQTGLRRKVGRMGLTIEVNPSSNLLIGHLGELGQHPLWRLAPVDGGQDGVPPLSVCIGSDDPLTFATTLPEEYQLLYDALIQNGCSEAMAHDWLDRARKAGLSARFTLPQSALPQAEDVFRYTSAGSPELDLPP